MNADHLIDRARDRFTLQDYHGAAFLLEEIIVGGQGYPDVHHMLGLALSMLRQLERALEEFDRALSMNPNYIEAHLHRGIILSELGRVAEAEEAFRRAASHTQITSAGLPAHAAGRIANEHARLGESYADAGAVDLAIEQYRRAIDLGPEFHDLRFRLSRLLLSAGRTLEARDELERIVGSRPGFFEARATLGLACFLSGDAPGARGVWDACARERPDDPRIRAYLAMLSRIER